MWGRRRPSPGVRASGRFTPTRVGKTSLSPCATVTVVVHPHACGEDPGHPRRGRYRRGSPPRVWGRLWRQVRLELDRRFTPTRVGKTRHGTFPAGTLLVHPHACGEDGRLSSTRNRSSGSPPRVWGRLVMIDTRKAALMVHPHACGEDVLPSVVQNQHVRFTPTRVGKTRYHRDPLAVHGGSPPRVWGRRGSRPRAHRRRLVHPHACGED